uniref:Uncharacterized protein n=1 Tax=Siphoviridae sp. ctNHg2 TaxID=2825467 RepID=A0A8S5V4K7_9CAUD|nr:MAG TPA: hypothetical protein [Siphoviridae sp. ctNHg2]
MSSLLSSVSPSFIHPARSKASGFSTSIIAHGRYPLYITLVAFFSLVSVIFYIINNKKTPPYSSGGVQSQGQIKN